jgi:hypothetical protein
MKTIRIGISFVALAVVSCLALGQSAASHSAAEPLLRLRISEPHDGAIISGNSIHVAIVREPAQGGALPEACDLVLVDGVLQASLGAQESALTSRGRSSRSPPTQRACHRSLQSGCRSTGRLGDQRRCRRVRGGAFASAAGSGVFLAHAAGLALPGSCRCRACVGHNCSRVARDAQAGRRREQFGQPWRGGSPAPMRRPVAKRLAGFSGILLQAFCAAWHPSAARTPAPSPSTVRFVQAPSTELAQCTFLDRIVARGSPAAEGQDALDLLRREARALGGNTVELLPADGAVSQAQPSADVTTLIGNVYLCVR